MARTLSNVRTFHSEVLEALVDVPPNCRKRTWLGLTILEKLPNLRIAIFGETQTYPHVFNVEIGHITRWFDGFKFLDVRFNPGRPNNC